MARYLFHVLAFVLIGAALASGLRELITLDLDANPWIGALWTAHHVG